MAVIGKFLFENCIEGRFSPKIIKEVQPGQWINFPVKESIRLVS
jgi:hypothetical protein